MSKYTDDTLLYVDPKTRTVIGPVEWASNGLPKKQEMIYEEKEGTPPRKRRKKQYYPWCSYRTAKRLYRIEGKQQEQEEYRSLDDAMKLAISEAFWE